MIVFIFLDSLDSGIDDVKEERKKKEKCVVEYVEFFKHTCNQFE